MENNNNSKCQDCQSESELKMNGFIVCSKCGLTKERIFVDYHPSFSDQKYNSTIQNSIGKNLNFIGALGSQIGYSTGMLTGYRGQKINPRVASRYYRLIRNHQKRYQIEGNATHLRTMIAFTRVINQLSLSNDIKIRALHLYWKQVNNNAKITNHVLLIALCLLLSVREMGNLAPVTFSEIINTFSDNNHRVTNRNILRLALELGLQIGPKRRKAEDYINRIVHKIVSHDDILNRIQIRGMKREQYETCLIIISNMFLSFLDRRDRGGVQPFPFAVSIVYLSDRAINKSIKKKPILTQKSLADIVSSAEFTIRDHVYRFLGSLYKNNEKKLISSVEKHFSNNRPTFN